MQLDLAACLKEREASLLVGVGNTMPSDFKRLFHGHSDSEKTMGVGARGELRAHDGK
jgi:hypothetical protein